VRDSEPILEAAEDILEILLSLRIPPNFALWHNFLKQKATPLSLESPMGRIRWVV
jgi:hypothetical protein